MDDSDPTALALVQAVRSGDTATLGDLLRKNPGLASEQVHGTRTPLHVATDWPGYFPNGPAVIRMLLEAGADPNAVVTGKSQAETPLHWAASTDDSDVAEELINDGADIEATGGSIGTPLHNAVGYGCWHVARLLVQRGAQVSTLWEAAALGMMTRVDELLALNPPPDADDLTEAFWQACHGGQRRVAERLAEAGADINGTPGYSDQTAADVAASPDTRRENLVDWLHSIGAGTAGENR
jgi:ankyrin repeat protein